MESEELEQERVAEQEYEKGKRRSFRQGAVAGFVLALLLSLLGITVFYIARQQVEKELAAKEDMSTAREVVANNRVQKKLETLANIIDNEYIEEVNVEDIESYLYKGLFAGTGDLYSGYLSEKELTRYVENATGSYSGIGVTMQYDEELHYVKIVEIKEDGPASEVDIQVGDYISKVDGEDATLATSDTSKLVEKVRGEEGTKVKLTLLRGEDKHEVEVEVERRNIESTMVEGQMLENHIGYIQLLEFEGLVVPQFQQIYEQLKAEGAQGLIVDLRGNPGGQIDSVVAISDYFLPEGIVTYTEDKKGNRRNYTCSGQDTWDKPLVVLMDGNSASASEIFAGAVRDYKVGTLLGTKSFGKGIVQKTIGLEDNTAVKITFAKYYTPNGENIHKKGIEPDVEVAYQPPEEGSEYEVATDNQIQAAVENIRKQIAEQ